MPLTTKSVTTRADKLIGAWKQFAAAKTINGHTVAAYETLAKAARDADAALTAAEAAVTAARNTLAASVAALNTASNEVVEGVRGDKTLGGRNGSLYEAMGYVRKDEQASGLTRKKAVAPAKKV